MGVTVARALLAAFGALLMLGGIGLAALGSGGDELIGALSMFVPGAILLLAVVLERTRYRSLAADHSGDAPGPGGGETAPPDARFRATDEVFVDPTSNVRMRVFLDTRTGDRRYVPEG